MLAISQIQTPVGWLHLKANDRALLSASFSDFPVKEIAPNDILTETEKQLQAYLSGNLHEFQLPLQLSGTAFQQAVWTLLTKISFGKTISYRTLSLQYGDIKAIRAVASANGQNPFAIIVPCHRVIGSNGTLTGYAGGLHRKKWLLEHEMKITKGTEQLALQW